MLERTLRVLEFNSIRKMLMDQAVCVEARERLGALLPVENIYEARELLKITSEAESLLIKKSAPPISPVRNILGAAKRAAADGVLSMSELLTIGHTLRMARGLIRYFEEDGYEELFPSLSSLFSALSENKKLENSIFGAILSDEEMADDASVELLAIRRKMRSLHSKIRDVLNDMVHSPSYSNLLQEPIVSMRGDRYVIPVKSEHKGQVPGVVHDSSASGATLFVEPMAAVEINNKLRELHSQEKDEIERILASLSSEVAEYSTQIAENYKIIIDLDFAFAKGKLARKMNASMPELNSDGIINIKKGRHPLIDEKKVVPTDIYLGKDFDTLVITGPNTGGKTVSLKTLGLFTLMAQSGLCIPAGGGSQIAVFENVFADIGDEQSIEQSLSTFSAHMTNIIKILDKANYNSLILFDELCSGTDPTEGAALAVSILERARNLGAKVAATTHYSEIKLYALSTDRVENAACEFDVASLRPTYKLLIGVPGKSNAFAISKRLGLSDDIIDRARELVDGESTRFEDVITSLEEHRAKAQQELDEAEEAKAQSLAQRQEAEKERSRIKAQREKLLNDARRDAKKIYEQAKKEADAIVKKMQKLFEESASNNRTAIEEGRRELKKGLDKAEGRLSEDVFKNKSKKRLDPKKITLGQLVEVTTMNSTGNVLTLPDKKGDLTVQVGILKIKTNVNALAPAKEETKKKSAQSYIASESRMYSEVKMELDLRGETVDDALLLTDKYLDDASLSHLETVTIIHGKGTGALRSAITDMLRHHPHVKSFRGGRYGEGEAGVTVVEIK
ncbi:MAG: endonuclease MutS2 [Ruminococcaceae bacterium]|nr:endonuclease MutS2 [Oscillospiraceae bacterium]